MSLHAPLPVPDADATGDRLPEEAGSRGRLGALATLLVAGALVAALSAWGPLHGHDWTATLRAWLARAGAWAPLAFVSLGALAIGAGAPRLLFAFVGGAAFGAVGGSALAQLATVLGCVVTFSVARWSGRPYAQSRLARRFPRLHSGLELIGAHPVASNLALRLAPIGNCFAVNLLMSMTSMRLEGFVAGTLLGVLPETLVYALLGAGIVQAAPRLWLTSASIFALLCVGYWLLLHRSRLARRMLRGVYDHEPS
jgi:uncharacterized membrane protein YdjX (TVP38/TMEM64 family)